MVDQAGNKTGGRKQGPPNRFRAEAEAAAAALGITPLQYMLEIMADGTAEPERRDRMAAAAAPYVHPKLQSVEHAGSIDHQISHEERLKELG